MNIHGSQFLVTGGSGFIGQALARHLVGHGAVVRIADLHPTSALDDIPHTYIAVDITDPATLAPAFAGVDGVFHMAVLPLGACTNDPQRCFAVNVAGTHNVLEAARVAGVKRVVFSSASSVYGDTIEVMDESHPLNARTVYGISKIIGETLCRWYWERYQLPFVALRYMNVYGPGQTGGVIFHTLNNLAHGKPPRINGDGKQSFDFVHVADVAKANRLAMKSDATDVALNIGGLNEYSLNDVVAAVLSLVREPIDPEYAAGDVPMLRRVGSSELAAQRIGYFPTFQAIRDGLIDVIKADFPHLLKEEIACASS